MNRSTRERTFALQKHRRKEPALADKLSTKKIKDDQLASSLIIRGNSIILASALFLDQKVGFLITRPGELSFIGETLLGVRSILRRKLGTLQTRNAAILQLVSTCLRGNRT